MGVCKLACPWVVLACFSVLGTAAPAVAHAQGDNAVREGALRVFLDCNSRNCNSTYFRTEVEFVSWVRDRTLAQVHLIMSSEQTGSGGFQYQFDFIGLEDLADNDDRLEYLSLGTDTREEVLLGISRVIAVGLARYSVLGGAAEGIVVARSGSQRDLPQGLVTGEEVEDPWNFWVFNVGLNGNVSGESRQSSLRVGGNFSASRTTVTWKTRTRVNGSFSRRTVELSDGDDFIDERTNWSANQLAVYTLAEHWSLGAEVQANASTRFNQDLGIDVLPAVEYSFFPYEEATRRSLTAFYEIGVKHFNWEEETVFGKTSETRAAHALRLVFSQQQTWGDATVGLGYESFLEDLGQNSVALGGGLSFRVFRGFRLNLSATAERIRDQIFLPAGGLTDEEILISRLALASSFDYRMSLGFSYQFGSIFNNVVNNRF